jgi:hypothetical protein
MKTIVLASHPHEATIFLAAKKHEKGHQLVGVPFSVY